MLLASKYILVALLLVKVGVKVVKSLFVTSIIIELEITLLLLALIATKLKVVLLVKTSLGKLVGKLSKTVPVNWPLISHSYLALLNK